MKKILTTLLLLTLCLPVLKAEDEGTPEPQKKRPTVGLVLSGGGAKGMAHIGALKIIEDLGIPIDYVVGTSIGSIIGGFYALGYDADELDSLVRAQDWDVLMLDQVDRRNVSFSFKEDNDRYLLAIPFLNHKNLTEETEADKGKGLLRNMPSAYVSGQNLDQLFTKLSVGYQDDIDFNTLPIPFACVAVDLNTKEEVVWHSGDIVTAIRSSMSIPGYFAPVQVGDRYLIDGGMLNNLPVDVVKQMGADYVITIDLHHYKKARPDTDQTIPEMVATMLSIMNGEKYHSGIAASDIVISPNVSEYGVLAFDEKSVDALIDSGRVAALEVMPQLRSLAGHLKEYPDLEQQRPPHAVDLSRDSVLISQMEVHGSEASEVAWLLSKTDIAPGKYVSGDDMDKAMNFFYSTRCFRKATYSIAGKEDEGYRLKINFIPQRVHQAGIGFRFDSEEMASILLGVSLNKRKLFGSKLDFEVELGLNANGMLRYGYTFRNLTRLNVTAQLLHTSMDVYADLSVYEEEPVKQKYGLDRTERYNVFRSEVNYQITGWKSADIQFGVRYDNMECREMSAVNFIDGHYKAQAAIPYASWRLDNLNDAYFPTQGFQLRLEGGAYFIWGEKNLYNDDNTSYSQRSYEAQLDFKAAIPLSERVTLVPQLWNRWLFGNPFNYYSNYVGGTMYGRYTQKQIPFIGLNHTYAVHDRLDVARADLRIKLFKQHYLNLTANYMFNWGVIRSLNMFEHHYGFGAAYAVNTFIGPIQFLVHWSDLSRKVGFHFSLGYDF